MLILKRIRDWITRKKPPFITPRNASPKHASSRMMDPNVSPRLAHDLGVTVTRIRLPSGGEVVIVERLNSDD